ncbi:hypothetical protein [Nonomuraea sediminis]|uniref:hypothetical protein n=1 Tax=Nonomuraea sediminis TaxID=2835864 RepID=UPI001BDC91C7|nr:hypothetical protein [Nonomuraea sediminis]
MRHAMGIILAGAIATTGLSATVARADAYCDAVAKADQMGQQMSQELKTNDPAKIGEMLDKARAEVQKVAEVAPESVKGDWQEQAQAIDEIKTAIKDTVKASADPAKLQEIQTKVKDAQAKIKESSAKISADAKTRCQ